MVMVGAFDAILLHRQRNIKNIVSVFAFSPYFSVMLLDYAVGYRKSETVALSVVSCLIYAVEPLEDILAFLLCILFPSLSPGPWQPLIICFLSL